MSSKRQILIQLYMYKICHLENCMLLLDHYGNKLIRISTFSAIIFVMLQVHRNLLTCYVIVLLWRCSHSTMCVLFQVFLDPAFTMLDLFPSLCVRR